MAGILIVEDEGIIAQDMEHRLLGLGYPVVGSAATGSEAVEKALSLKPSLVLMDIQLRGQMDGIQAAQAIREQLDVPVIFVTSFSDGPTVKRATEESAYGYVVKPVTDTNLRTAIEITLQRHLLEVQLRQQERWHRTTLRSIGDGVIATTPDQQVAFLNPAAEELTGWKQEEAAGRALDEVMRLMSEGTGDPVQPPVNQALSEGRVTFLPNGTVLLKRDGESLSIDDCAAPILDDAGQLLGAVLVFRDVSERRQMEDELLRLNAEQERRSLELEAVNRELEAFAHTVAHDLRGPLSAIGQAVEAMLQHHGQTLPPDVSRLMKRIVDGVAHMDELTQDLLEYSRLSLAEVELAPVELSSLVAETIRTLEPVIEDTGASVAVAEPLPEVLGHVILKHMVSNLLTNALKFVRPGETPEVQIYCEERGQTVRLYVQDNGIGISPEHQEEIFDIFNRAGAGEERPGTGIGLAIVRRGAERLGGAVGVESEPGKGSRFWIELLKPDHARQATERRERSP